jgi:hypothetical protein
MLSSQRLFNKKKVIFGSFSGDEDTFELKLNDNPIISVPYDSRSALPIAEVLVGPEPEPTVNLTILEPGNQNFTGGHKLFLERHYLFGISIFNRYKMSSEELHLWQKDFLQQ